MALSLSEIEKRKKNKVTSTSPEASSPAKKTAPRRPWDSPTPEPQTTPTQGPKNRKTSNSEGAANEGLKLTLSHSLPGYLKSMLTLNRDRLAQGKGLRLLLPIGYKQKKPRVF